MCAWVAHRSSLSRSSPPLARSAAAKPASPLLLPLDSSPASRCAGAAPAGCGAESAEGSCAKEGTPGSSAKDAAGAGPSRCCHSCHAWRSASNERTCTQGTWCEHLVFTHEYMLHRPYLVFGEHLLRELHGTGVQLWPCWVDPCIPSTTASSDGLGFDTSKAYPAGWCSVNVGCTFAFAPYSCAIILRHHRTAIPNKRTGYL